MATKVEAGCPKGFSSRIAGVRFSYRSDDAIFLTQTNIVQARRRTLMLIKSAQNSHK